MRARLKIFLIFVLTSLVFVSAAQASSLRRVTDQLGRTITLQGVPRRVVALAPSVTEIAFAVGGGTQLVGRTRYSNHPAQAAALPVVGTYVNLDVERIVTLQPDLCLAVKDGTPRGVLTALSRFNIPVFSVRNDDLATVMGAITAIGSALGHENAAQAVVQDMQDRIECIKKRTAGVTHRPGVFYQINAAPIITPGGNTFLDELIRLAGGTNLTADASGYPHYTMEQALELQPEVIIVPSMATDSTYEDALAAWAKWPHIPAVRDGRIHKVTSDLFDRPTPRLVEGLERMARLLHPELFGCGK